MPDLSTIRVHRSQTFTVNADGSQGELVEETAPRWTETENGISFSEWADCAEWCRLPVAPEPPADTLGIGAEHTVEVDEPAQ